MKFDFIIGNPPYQDETFGENKTYAPSIYDKFLDGAYQMADCVEMIHPARFLFNAGDTPKSWNQKMLSDPNLKVLWYEQDSGRIFNNTDIKGGIAITYHDKTKNFGAIQAFSPYEEIYSIVPKVTQEVAGNSLTNIMYNQMRFDLETLYKEYPEYETIIGSQGKDKRFRNNIFEKIPLFSLNKKNDDDVAVLGVLKNKRQWRYIPKEFCDWNHGNISKWKVIIVSANGTGALGEVLSEPVVLSPGEAYTQTFIGIGSFETESEAKNALKYIKTKFFRLMLSPLKITQHNSIETFRLIPNQDFTRSSDIDWSKSIPEIDKQLYAKYGLDDDEIAFIESHVKEMA